MTFLNKLNYNKARNNCLFVVYSTTQLETGQCNQYNDQSVG